MNNPSEKIISKENSGIERECIDPINPIGRWDKAGNGPVGDAADANLPSSASTASGGAADATNGSLFRSALTWSATTRRRKRVVRPQLPALPSSGSRCAPSSSPSSSHPPNVSTRSAASATRHAAWRPIARRPLAPCPFKQFHSN